MEHNDALQEQSLEEANRILQLRLDETNTLIDDLLRKIARLRAENEALWEERGGPR